MRSLQIGVFAGIPVKIHWTFGLFILFLLGYGLLSGINGVDLVWFFGFIFAMFLCVILHEFGHALSARKYGVKTLDILISPIGGLARLERLPEKPIQELIVAIAGPLVNVVIGALIFIVMYVIYQDFSFLSIQDNVDTLSNPKSFFGLLIYTNAVLFLFNLIPAFPMDGGRILRALLTMKLGRVRGTQIASVIGRVLAGVFVILALVFENYMLILIGAFIFIMARNENQQVIVEAILKKGKASDIMKTNFSKIHISESMRSIFQKYISGGEKNFLIFDSMDNVSGVIPELFIKQAFKEGILDTTTANEYMSKKILTVDSEIPLSELFEEMNKQGVAIAEIKNGDQTLGVVDRHMLQNYIQVHLYK